MPVERALSKVIMGDVIDIHDWVEQRVNTLAQRFRVCRNTVDGKKLECVLKEWGFRMARFKIHYLRTQREQEEHTYVDTK